MDVEAVAASPQTLRTRVAEVAALGLTLCVRACKAHGVNLLCLLSLFAPSDYTVSVNHMQA